MTDKEAVARAMCASASPCRCDRPGNYCFWQTFENNADAAIAALTARGWQKIEPGSVVAQQFVDEMKLANEALLSVAADLDRLSERDLAEFARAMIAAATKKPASDGAGGQLGERK